jgi:hypothetical protein
MSQRHRSPARRSQRRRAASTRNRPASWPLRPAPSSRGMRWPGLRATQDPAPLRPGNSRPSCGRMGACRGGSAPLWDAVVPRPLRQVSRSVRAQCEPARGWLRSRRRCRRRCCLLLAVRGRIHLDDEIVARLPQFQPARRSHRVCVEIITTRVTKPDSPFRPWAVLGDPPEVEDRNRQP